MNCCSNFGMNRFVKNSWQINKKTWIITQTLERTGLFKTHIKLTKKLESLLKLCQVRKKNLRRFIKKLETWAKLPLHRQLNLKTQIKLLEGDVRIHKLRKAFLPNFNFFTCLTKWHFISYCTKASEVADICSEMPKSKKRRNQDARASRILQK